MKDSIISFVMAIVMMFIFLIFAIVAGAAHRCGRCLILEYNISKLMNTIEEDCPDYVMDVLSEEDAWLELEELTSERPIITDSTYRKMRNVFPDLPSSQAK